MLCSWNSRCLRQVQRLTEFCSSFLTNVTLERGHSFLFLGLRACTIYLVSGVYEPVVLRCSFMLQSVYDAVPSMGTWDSCSCCDVLDKSLEQVWHQWLARQTSWIPRQMVWVPGGGCHTRASWRSLFCFIQFCLGSCLFSGSLCQLCHYCSCVVWIFFVSFSV